MSPASSGANMMLESVGGMSRDDLEDSMKQLN